METKVVIVGAGLSGIMAARTLMERGITDILLVEKSRSVGGRLATRRIGEGKADHGAQFFTVRSPELEKGVESWLQEGWVRRWFGDSHPRYTGTEGMNALAKNLATGLTVRLNTKVLSITEHPHGCELHLEKGEVIKADHVLITAPAPQAAELLGVEAPVAFRPCLVGLLTLEGPSGLPTPGHLDGEQLPYGVERIVDHKEKGISSTTVLSVYMTGEWSEEHFSESDEKVLARIIDLVRPYLGGGSEGNGNQLKRWRYAEAAEVVDQPLLDAGKRMIMCGDAFLTKRDESGKTRFESAYLSGKSAGEFLADRVGDS
ncbi:NAD(P)/FAD-dependent oxidoreductase [Rossellomorea marisflavi]|uniref:NAD(P)/FAD-dependent oxidoreductase n=1 Tax=Rossellomorea marisflavi TaxID=189381 RepID=UPI00345B45A0